MAPRYAFGISFLQEIANQKTPESLLIFPVIILEVLYKKERS